MRGFGSPSEDCEINWCRIGKSPRTDSASEAVSSLTLFHHSVSISVLICSLVLRVWDVSTFLALVDWEDRENASDWWWIVAKQQRRAAVAVLFDSMVKVNRWVRWVVLCCSVPKNKRQETSIFYYVVWWGWKAGWKKQQKAAESKNASRFTYGTTLNLQSTSIAYFYLSIVVSAIGYKLSITTHQSEIINPNNQTTDFINHDS